MRGETYRRIFIHCHAADGQPAADIVLYTYRGADGVPTVEVVAAPPGTRVHVDPNAAAAAVHVQAVRETAKASEAQPWRAPRIAPHERRAADRERAPDAIDAYWATWSTEDPE
jgi:hypothetical protein